jgi:hypothetical protein
MTSRPALSTAALEIVRALDAERIHFDRPEDAAMLHGLLAVCFEVVLDGRFAANAQGCAGSKLTTPVVLPLAGADLGADGRAVIAATGQGDISPDQAKTLLSGLGTLARITEVDELVRRIEALEKSIHAETKN